MISSRSFVVVVGNTGRRTSFYARPSIFVVVVGNTGRCISFYARPSIFSEEDSEEDAELCQVLLHIELK